MLAAALYAAAVLPIQLSHYFAVDSFTTVFIVAMLVVLVALVHLVNLPESDHIIMRHEQPPAKSDLTVTVQLPAGSEVLDCVEMMASPSEGSSLMTAFAFLNRRSSEMMTLHSRRRRGK